MPENLLGLLKLCLLALLYLFFLRVLWAVWAEVRGPKPAKAGNGNSPNWLDNYEMQLLDDINFGDKAPIRSAHDDRHNPVALRSVAYAQSRISTPRSEEAYPDHKVRWAKVVFPFNEDRHDDPQ